MVYTSGQGDNYAVDAAILYLLEHRDVSYLRVEGHDFEDSIFFQGQDRIALGEGKLRSRRKSWTLKTLFMESSKKAGPALQLWNKWKGHEDALVFTNIPFSNKISIDNHPVFSKQQLKSILGEAEAAGLLKVTYSDTRATDFQNKLTILHRMWEQVILGIIDWCQKNGGFRPNGIKDAESMFHGSVGGKAKIEPRKAILECLIGTPIRQKAVMPAKYSLESLRGEIHAEVSRAFKASGWTVDFSYRLGVTTDLSRFTAERGFEALASRLGRTDRGRIRYYVPIRSLVMPEEINSSIVFPTASLNSKVPLPFRFLPLRGITLGKDEIEEFRDLFHERSTDISVASTCSGILTAEFKDVLDNLLKDGEFLYNNLQKGELISDYILMQIGGDLSNSMTLLCPAMVVNGAMLEDDDSGRRSKVTTVMFEKQGRYFDVIARPHVKDFADSLTREFNDIRDFLSIIGY